jgi:hypothetical protein
MWDSVRIEAIKGLITCVRLLSLSCEELAPSAVIGELGSHAAFSAISAIVGTKPTSGCDSVGIVRSRTQATEFSFFYPRQAIRDNRTDPEGSQHVQHSGALCFKNS